MSLRTATRPAARLARTRLAAAPARTVFNWFKGQIADDAEHAVGREGAEIKARAMGYQLFQRDPIQAPFGTEERPKFVPSGKDFRIIGCVGGVEGTAGFHDVVWFRLDKDQPTRCPECSQVFVLMPQEAWWVFRESPEEFYSATKSD